MAHNNRQNAITQYELWRGCRVTDVKSVSEFLDRYYKPDRYTSRGPKYAAVLLESHEKDFKDLGVDWISHHDSITGRDVSFYGD